jgi:uncharacterized repeat protein (TIGR01451 family)
MKTQRTGKKRTVRWLSTLLLFGVIFTVGFPAGAWAIGTEAGSSIDNRAVINYSVGSVPQTLIESSPTGNNIPGATNGADTSFLVDNMIDLSVQTLDAAPVTLGVVPGSTERVLSFQVNNEGNYVQDFLLTTDEKAPGLYAMPFVAPDNNLTDIFNADTTTNPVRIFIDSDGSGSTATYTPSTWDGAGTEIAATFIDELPRDESITVYIVIDIPLATVNGDIAVYGLLAQVAQGGTSSAPGAAINSDDSASADLPGTVQLVFSDGSGPDDPDTGNPDGWHSSRSAYRVGSAALAVQKTSVVTADPTGSGNPKAIPGATVQYTIAITNSGTTTAQSLQIVDQIPDNTDFAVGSVTSSQAGVLTIDYSNTAPPGPPVWGYGPLGAVDPAVTYIRVTLPSDIGFTAPNNTDNVQFDVVIE